VENANLKNSRYKRLIIFLFPVVFYLFTEILRIYDTDAYLDFRDEDGIIEWLTFVFYMLAGVTSFLIYKKITGEYLRRKFFYLLLSFACFFIAFEEISWGQRIFDIETPELFIEYNDQDQIDLHNIEFPLIGLDDIFDISFIFICLYGIFSRLVLSKILRENTYIYCPSRILIFYFLFALLGVFWQIEAIENYIDNNIMPYGQEVFGIAFFIFYDPEMSEFLLSMGFFLFVYLNKQQIYKDI